MAAAAGPAKVAAATEFPRPVRLRKDSGRRLGSRPRGGRRARAAAQDLVRPRSAARNVPNIVAASGISQIRGAAVTSGRGLPPVTSGMRLADPWAGAIRARRFSGANIVGEVCRNVMPSTRDRLDGLQKDPNGHSTPSLSPRSSTHPAPASLAGARVRRMAAVSVVGVRPGPSLRSRR